MYTPPAQFIKRDKRYDDFTCSRLGYWIGLIILSVCLHSMPETTHIFYFGVGAFIQLILTAARCRDAGLNGWWCLVTVIPFTFLYFGFIRPDDHPKKLHPFEKLKANTDKLRIGPESGYTFIELLIVAAVVAVLAGIAYATYGWAIDRARVAATIGDLGEIHMQVQMFDLNNRRHPTSLAEINLEGKLDPWGNEYQYLSFDNVNGNGPKRKNRGMVPVNTSYDVYSMGPDGETATPFTSVSARDDIVMAVDGAYFGKVGDFE